MGLKGAMGHRRCGMQIGHGVILKLGVREGILELKALCWVLKNNHELAIWTAWGVGEGIVQNGKRKQ